jgi:hypothetical protein
LTDVVRRLWPLISFSSVALVLGGFVLFTVSIADPVQRVLKEPFARGVVVPDEALRGRGPLYTYVALHAGTPRLDPQQPVDDMLTEPDGRFALRADPAHGERFFVFARIETTGFDTYCVVRPLPRLRARDDSWEVAATGEELPELRIEVGPTNSCAG